MKKILLVNERYGRFSGAEQNIYVTLPYISKKFDVHFLYDQDTDKDSHILDEIISSKTKYNFNEKNHQSYRNCAELLKNIKP